MDLLIAVGPIVVVIMTMTMTALFLGPLGPAEATVLVAAFLADRGVFTRDDVTAAVPIGAS